MYRSAHIFLVVLITAFSSLYGQYIEKVESPFTGIIIGSQNGLSSSQVRHILKDNRGYFYFFMSNTIQRWDGQVLTEVIKAEDNFYIDFSTIRRPVFIDAENILILPTYIHDAVFTLNIKTHTVTPHKIPTKGYHFYADGKIYTQNLKKDIQVIHAFDTTVVSTINLPIEEPIKKIIPWGKKIVVSSSEGNFIIQDNQLIGKFTAFDQIATIGDQLYAFSNNRIYKHVENQIKPIATIPVNKKSDFKPFVIKNDDAGNLVIAYGPLDYVMHKVISLSAHDEIKDYSTLINSTNQRVTDFYVNGDQRKWLIATHNGVFGYQFGLKGISRPIYITNLRKNAYGLIVTSILEQDKDIYFLEEVNKLIKYDPHKGSFSEPYLEKFKERVFSTDWVSNVANIDPNKSSYYFNNQKFKKLKNGSILDYSLFSYSYDSLSNIHMQEYIGAPIQEIATVPFRINDIEEIKENQLLIVGKKGTVPHIAFLDLITGEIDNITMSSNSTFKSVTYDHYLDAYWIGMNPGLMLVSKDLDHKELPFTENAEYDKLSATGVFTFLRWGPRLVIATRNGLYFQRSPNGPLESLNESDGLSHQICYSLLIDDNERLWVGTQSGLTVLDKDFNIIETFQDYDGLGEGNNEFNFEAAYKTEDGMLYFGTVNGLIKIQPNLALANQRDAGLDINQVHFFYQNNLKASHPYDKDGKIKSNFKFDSVVIDIARPDIIRRLDDNNFSRGLAIRHSPDYDIKWHENHIILSHFKSKSTELNLLHKTNNNKLLELSLVHDPNYSNLMYLLLITGLIAFVAYSVSSFVIQKNKKKHEEKLEAENYVNNLQLRTLQAQMNPHFIFNTLGSIQYYMQTHDLDSAEQYLTDFASLTRMFLESSKSDSITLRDELELLNLYLKIEQSRFENIFDFDIEVAGDVDLSYEIAPMVLQPFIENSINHGLLNLKDTKGLLQVNVFQPNDSEVICVIDDNGIGRENAKQLTKIRRHKSRALQILNEKIHILKKFRGKHIDFVTLDKVHADGSPAGTQVTVTFRYL